MDLLLLRQEIIRKRVYWYYIFLPFCSRPEIRLSILHILYLHLCCVNNSSLLVYQTETCQLISILTLLPIFPVQDLTIEQDCVKMRFEIWEEKKGVLKFIYIATIFTAREASLKVASLLNQWNTFCLGSSTVRRT